MNPKVAKLKEEREKNCEKIAALQARNKKIDVSMHTAAASGRWCGAERPLCGLSNSRH